MLDKSSMKEDSRLPAIEESGLTDGRFTGESGLMDKRFKEVSETMKHTVDLTLNLDAAIEHHHANNRHHTAFHKNEFSGMNLFDILEMLADWKAASRRSPNLSFADSLPKAFEKYSVPKNMQKHIMETLKYLKWI